MANKHVKRCSCINETRRRQTALGSSAGGRRGRGNSEAPPPAGSLPRGSQPPDGGFSPLPEAPGTWLLRTETLLLLSLINKSSNGRAGVGGGAARRIPVYVLRPQISQLEIPQLIIHITNAALKEFTKVSFNLTGLWHLEKLRAWGKQ